MPAAVTRIASPQERAQWRTGCPSTTQSSRGNLACRQLLQHPRLELMAYCSCACEVLYARKLAAELGFCQLSPTKIYEDNEGAMVLVKNMHLRNRSKHIALRFSFAQILYQLGKNKLVVFRLLFLPSTSMQTSAQRRLVSRSSIAPCQYGWAKYCLPNPEESGGCFGSTWERRGLKT